MGTYTELVLKCYIKEDRPEIVHDVLNFLFGKDSEPPYKLPDHPFFNKIRWEAIGRSGSYYHCPNPTNFYDGKYLFTRSDFKNYDDEIDCFLDWLKPYISLPKGQFMGWIFLEQTKEPIFLYNDDDEYNEENLSDKWIRLAKKSLIDCSKVFIEEGHKNYEYEYCENCIHSSILYLKRKRGAIK
jgi:hypothetical protein